MAEAGALFLTFYRIANTPRLNLPAVEAEWERWYDEQYIVDVSKVLGARSATRWRVVTGPAQFGTMYELDGEGGAAVQRLAAALPKWREAGWLHPKHKMLTTALVRPIRRFNGWENSVPELKGRFATFTSANDPRETESWNAWYQSTHTPDAIGCGAFTSAVRCEAVPHTPTEEVYTTAAIAFTFRPSGRWGSEGYRQG